MDVYAQANRAVKYALLFVLLTFAAFFLFEILRELRIHPVQYARGGPCARRILPASPSPFRSTCLMPAYAISAGACVTLIANLRKRGVAQRSSRAGFAAS